MTWHPISWLGICKIASWKVDLTKAIEKSWLPPATPPPFLWSFFQRSNSDARVDFCFEDLFCLRNTKVRNTEAQSREICYSVSVGVKFGLVEITWSLWVTANLFKCGRWSKPVPSTFTQPRCLFKQPCLFAPVVGRLLIQTSPEEGDGRQRAWPSFIT